MPDKTKKKFASDFKVKFSFADLLKNAPKSRNKPNYKEYDRVFIPIEDNRTIQGFLYYKGEKPYVIPEPDPNILYFTSAERNLENIIGLKNELLEDTDRDDLSKMHDLFIEFFIPSVDFVISLFSSIEAFHNKQISKDFKYIKGKRKLVGWDVQRYVNAEDKFFKVMPMIFKISFCDKYPEKYNILQSLGELRHSVIHIKNANKSFDASYRDIYRNLLDFDFQKAYNYTKDYMNFYVPDWIEQF